MNRLEFIDTLIELEKTFPYKNTSESIKSQDKIIVCRYKDNAFIDYKVLNIKEKISNNLFIIYDGFIIELLEQENNLYLSYLPENKTKYIGFISCNVIEDIVKEEINNLIIEDIFSRVIKEDYRDLIKFINLKEKGDFQSLKKYYLKRREELKTNEKVYR